jgi:DNA-binding NtrC family response regulator
VQKEKKILVVDDDKVILESLQGILKLEGYNVDTAKTGQEALEKSEEEFYHLVFLDIKLPDMKGTDLLKKICEKYPEMVKIMVTGYPDIDSAVNSLNMGADAYLIKPVNPGTLVETVKEKLRTQEEKEKMTQDKVKDWIETRVRKLKHGEENAKV